NTQRGFPDFVVRAYITNEGRINRVAENDERVVTGFNRIAAMHKCTRHYNKGVSRTDQETVFFLRADFRAELRDHVAQITFAGGIRSGKRKLSFRTLQSVFGSCEIWIRLGRFLGPAITGGRLEICRCAHANGHPICIGAVSIYIHIALEQERFSVRLRMLKLQDRLAIEKIMPREKY